MRGFYDPPKRMPDSYTCDAAGILRVSEVRGGGPFKLVRRIIKPHDLAQLKSVAAKLPGAIVVIAVLRDHFLPAEKKIIKRFVTWARRLDAHGHATNPVLLLTTNELMMEHHISPTWKELGGEHAKHSDFHSTRNPRNFANATQNIYLSIHSFYQWRDALFRKKAARRGKRSKPL